MEHIKETFPFKLYYTIEWASDSEFSSALMWSPSGNAFVVRDRDVMVEHIIPKFFDHKKWRSFVSFKFVGCISYLDQLLLHQMFSRASSFLRPGS